MVSQFVPFIKKAFSPSFKTILLGGFALTMLASAPVSAQSLDSLEAGCDPNFMYTLNKKAEIEAMRDVAMAQTHIKKPDSVFQLSCFNVVLNNASYVASFPSSVDYDIKASSLAFQINRALYPIVFNYTNDSFNHTILGGYPATNNVAPGIPGDFVGVDNHNFVPVTATQNYQCGQMQKVWWTAKCIDFDDSDFYYDSSNVIGTAYAQSESGFAQDTTRYSIFSDITAAPAPAGDGNTTSFGTTRLQTKNASCTTNLVGGYTWEQLASYAFNEDDTFYTFRAFLDPSLNVDDGVYTTYADNIVPRPWFSLTQDENTAGGCAPGILTGLKYTRSGDELCDGFCPNPGCTYEPSAPGNGGACVNPGACN